MRKGIGLHCMWALVMHGLVEDARTAMCVVLFRLPSRSLISLLLVNVCCVVCCSFAAFFPIGSPRTDVLERCTFCRASAPKDRWDAMGHQRSNLKSASLTDTYTAATSPCAPATSSLIRCHLCPLSSKYLLSPVRVVSKSKLSTNLLPSCKRVSARWPSAKWP